MKTKRPYKVVMPIAEALLEKLRPAFELFPEPAILGSLRREKAMIGDIEIIGVPKPVLDLFLQSTGETYVDLLLAEWGVALTKNGQKQKQFIFTTRSGEIYQVDLFLQPDPETWGVNFLLRTGSDRFNRRMVTRKSKHNDFGLKPDGYSLSGARVWYQGEKLDTPTEESIFELWGMDVVHPRERV